MYCKNCKYEHGDLYICPSYDEDTKIKLREIGNTFRKQCKTGNIPIKVNGKVINGKTAKPGESEIIITDRGSA